MECDREGSVKFAGEKDVGSSVDEAVNGLDERPAKDRRHGDVTTKGNAKVDWVAVWKSEGKNISDNGAKETGFKGSCDIWGIRLCDCASEANRLKRR